MFNNLLGHLGIIGWLGIRFRLMLMFTTTNHRPRNQPQCTSLDDIGLMPTKMSYNPLQKFRPYAGTKVNCNFNRQRTLSAPHWTVRAHSQ